MAQPGFPWFAYYAEHNYGMVRHMDESGKQNRLDFHGCYSVQSKTMEKARCGVQLEVYNCMKFQSLFLIHKETMEIIGRSAMSGRWHTPDFHGCYSVQSKTMEKARCGAQLEAHSCLYDETRTVPLSPCKNRALLLQSLIKRKEAS